MRAWLRRLLVRWGWLRPIPESPEWIGVDEATTNVPVAMYERQETALALAILDEERKEVPQATYDDLVVLRGLVDDQTARGVPLPTPAQFLDLAKVVRQVNQSFEDYHLAREAAMHARFLEERARVCGLTMRHPVEFTRPVGPGNVRRLYRGGAIGGDH